MDGVKINLINIVEFFFSIIWSFIKEGFFFGFLRLYILELV